MKLSEMMSRAKEQYKIENTLTCKNCSYKWVKRKETPKVCPNCKSSNWK